MLNDYRKLLFLNTAVLVPEKKIIIGFEVCTGENGKEMACWGLAPGTDQRAQPAGRTARHTSLRFCWIFILSSPSGTRPAFFQNTKPFRVDSEIVLGKTC